MKRNKFSLLIFLCVFILTLCIAPYLFISVEKKDRQLNELLRQLVLTKYQLVQQAIHGSSFKFPRAGLTIEGDKHLEELFREHNQLLVFRFSYRNCESCYMKELKMLEKLSAEEQEKVVIFASFSSINGKSIFESSQHLAFDILHVNDNFLNNIDVEKIMVPYYFVLEKNLWAKMVYLVEKDDRGASELYLNSVCDMLN